MWLFQERGCSELHMAKPYAPQYGLMSTMINADWQERRVARPEMASKLAADIGLVMPELYPGEHVQAAHLICTDNKRDSAFEILKIAIYKISNGFTFDLEGLEAIHDLLLKNGLLEDITDLKQLRNQSLTIRAFMDNLLQIAFKQIMHPRRPTGWNESIPKTIKALIKWLVCQRPQTKIHSNHGLHTPLETAIRFKRIELIELCLEVDPGADLDLNNGLGEFIKTLAASSRIPNVVVLRFIRTLLHNSNCTNVEWLLHAAIRVKDLDLVDEILGLNADPFRGLLPGQFDSPPYQDLQYQENALSIAATVGRDMTLWVLDRLQSRYPTAPLEDFVTCEVFIGAAQGGHVDVISTLHDISPTGFLSTLQGITPLHAAVLKGHLDASRMLLQLYNGMSPTLLFIACWKGRLDILQFLIESGADVNSTMGPNEISFCLQFIYNDIDFVQHHKPPWTTTSVLGVLLDTLNLNADRSDVIELMIESGAMIPAGAVTRFADHHNVEALSATLNAGGNPNECNRIGKSALNCAIFRPNKDRCTTVELLLARGATILVNDVLTAIIDVECDVALLVLDHWPRRGDVCDDNILIFETALIYHKGVVPRKVESVFSIRYDPTLLCAAISVGDRRLVNKLLAWRHESAETALLEGTAVGLAARWGDHDLLRTLLKLFKNPSIALLPDLIAGAWKGDGPLDTNWWHSGCVEGSPLALVVNPRRSTDGFSELLRNGYCADNITWIAASRHISYITLLMEYNQRLSGLSFAQFIWRCPEPHCGDYTYRAFLYTDRQHGYHSLMRSYGAPLLYGVFCENQEMVETLLKAGADITEIDDVEKLSAFQMAVMVGNLAIVNCLLEAGADVNAPPSISNGATALQLAAEHGHIGLVKQLLELGARVNARGSRNFGVTALEAAAGKGRIDVMQLLLDHGALITGAGHGQFLQAVRFAEEAGYSAAAQLLKQSWESQNQSQELYKDQGWVDPFYRCCDEIHIPGDQCIFDYPEDM